MDSYMSAIVVSMKTYKDVTVGADFNPCLAGRMLQLKQARNGRSLRAAASTEEKADSPATPASKATTDADPKKAEIDQVHYNLAREHESSALRAE